MRATRWMQALTAAQEYLAALDASLGRSAEVSASKMRYQMDRLRRLAATSEMQREASLRKHAEAITLHLFPNGHLQERVLAGVWFLAAWESAHGDSCRPHRAPGGRGRQPIRGPPRHPALIVSVELVVPF